LASRQSTPLSKWVVAAGVVLATFGATNAAHAQESLDAALQPYLVKYELPALAAAVFRDGKITAVGAVGTRRAGAAIPVTRSDRFHLGSDTKAMTSLMAGMLVEAGQLRWDTTIAEVFPELAPKMDAKLGKVTLEQLLSHTGGIPPDDAAIEALVAKSLVQPGNLDSMRYWLVGELVQQPLAFEPGTDWKYSNMGYVIAGAILERKTGRSWEELVTERVFEPLGLTTAGMGPQASMGRVDAPLAHDQKDGKLVPMLAGPNGDVPPTMAPAGAAHMSVLDFARWAAWNAGEGKHGPALVKPETLKKLHTPVIAMTHDEPAPGTPPSGRYALGWGEVTLDWTPEPFVFHGGSNTMNLAYVLFQPARDYGMVLMTNVGGEKADAALKALVKELDTRYAQR
jgi:CubicO group peptidase (beta-lactamase class C family)